MGPIINDGMETAEALLFGRRTWQGMAAAWPERAGDPYADKMNAIGKYVVSATLTEDDLSWNSTLIPGDRAVEEIAALRRQDGGDLITWGARASRRRCSRQGSSTSSTVMIEPILLGGGKRIFPDDGGARPLELVNTVASGDGRPRQHLPACLVGTTTAAARPTDRAGPR